MFLYRCERRWDPMKDRHPPLPHSAAERRAPGVDIAKPRSAVGSPFSLSTTVAARGIASLASSSAVLQYPFLSPPVFASEVRTRTADACECGERTEASAQERSDARACVGERRRVRTAQCRPTALRQMRSHEFAPPHGRQTPLHFRNACPLQRANAPTAHDRHAPNARVARRAKGRL